MHEPRPWSHGTRPWSYETCKTCRFYRKWEDARGGDCRRSPPVYIGPIPKDGWSCNHPWKYPPMDNDDWCGEHRPMEVVTNG